MKYIMQRSKEKKKKRYLDRLAYLGGVLSGNRIAKSKILNLNMF